MRLWSIHPQYLDRIGLIACWREGLLARKVLAGKTKGYKNHPQLFRFKHTAHPIQAMDTYLFVCLQEAEKRGYHFDRTKLHPTNFIQRIPIATGQIQYEWEHLLKKLQQRDVRQYENLKIKNKILTHPLFYKISGPVADWEKVL